MTLIRIAALLATAALLVGCSSESDEPATQSTTTVAAPSPEEPTMGLPAGIAANSSATAGAGLSTDGKLWIVTYGSSTNPLAVTDVKADGQDVTVTLEQGDGPATMDLVPSTTTVALPDGVSADEPVTVTLGDQGTVTPGEPGTVSWLPAK